MRIIFLGTPEIAKTVLNDILANGFNVDLILTQPDRPAGRGKKIVASPVKQLAVDKSLAILQPDSLKNNSEIIEISTLNFLKKIGKFIRRLDVGVTGQ